MGYLPFLARLRPAAAIFWNFALPYFLRPTAAATAAGSFTLPLSDFSSFAKRPPPPSFIDFLVAISLQDTTLQQSHLRRAKAFLVGRPLESFIGPGIPPIRAQNDLRRAAAFGLRFACFAETGGFRFMPCAFADARPLAFRPPFGSLPSLRCQAGDLAIALCPCVVNKVWVRATSLSSPALGCFLLRSRQRLGLLVWVLLVPESLFTCHASSSLLLTWQWQQPAYGTSQPDPFWNRCATCPCQTRA